AAISALEYDPNAGMTSSPPSGVRRFTPPITACTTLTALASFTAWAPVSVAYGVTGLMPVQSWQLTQAPSKISFPREFPAGPARCDGAAADARLASPGEDSGGTLRR